MRKTPSLARAGKQGATATPEASISAQIPDSSIHSHDFYEVISPPNHLDRDRASVDTDRLHNSAWRMAAWLTSQGGIARLFGDLSWTG